MTTRGPKRKVAADEVDLKRGKMDMMVQPKVEKVEMAEVKAEKKLTHYSCPICNLKLECEPGDMVMKRHYMEKHYTSGGLLEMVALDLEEGQKLRCPYPDCDVGNKPMKLLLLNIHLERNHNRLKKLIELDGRPGMDDVFLVMYDYEGFEKKKLLEGTQPVKPAMKQPALTPSAASMRFESDEDEDVDDPSWDPSSSNSRRSSAPPPRAASKPSPLPALVVPKTEPFVPFVKPKIETPAYTIISSVSTPAPCLLCKEKAGRDLRLVGDKISDVTEHYKLCLYNKGKLQAIVPPLAINTNDEGGVIDEMGHKFVYKCRVTDCDRARRGAKATAYKEFVFHCYQTHGLMKTVLEDCMETAPKEETKQKFRELIMAVVKQGEEHPETIPEPGVEETHVCLLCKGINRDTKKENKEAKALRFNICITRNHYSNCLNESDEGRVFFENKYPTDKGGPVKIKCDSVQCKNNKRFRDGFSSTKMFYNHMALYHGGLEEWMLSQDREDLRELVPKLLCHKLPEVCFVPDHYGQ